MAAEDDFAAFLAEIQTTATEDVATGEGEAKETEAGDKRPREEGTEASTDIAEAEPSAPAVKRAKVVVARARPQVIKAGPQPPEEPPAPQEEAPSSSSYHGGGGASSSYMQGPPVAPAGPAAGPGYYGGQQAQYPGQRDAYNQGGGGGPSGAYDPAMAAAEAAYACGGGGGGGGAGGQGQGEQPRKKKPILRVGAGETWVDPTLLEWPENDFRIFCGDLGNEVTDEVLSAAFRKYTSFAKAKVVRDKTSGKSKGYGFLSFLDPFEGLKACREMNLKYVGSRPVKLRKSDWKERNVGEVKKKEKQKKKFLKSLGIS